MRRRSLRPSFARTALRLAPVLAVVGLASCEDIDTTRVAPFKTQLGDDLYGVLCDRLGASVLAEDTSSASYHAICHPTADGVYADDVDTSVLPDVTAAAQDARNRSIAKMRAMARWRSDLVHAFNALFPADQTVTDAQGNKVPLHDGLMKLGQALTPLYETNPFDSQGEPLFPSSTRALGRALDAIAQSDDAKAALSRIWARHAYRPYKVELGAVRAALSYPNLRDFTKASLAVLGPGGAAEGQLQQLFRAVKHELATSQAKDSSLPLFHLSDVPTDQPNRPRTTLEFTADLVLSEDSAYADSGAGPWYVALRDRRGIVVPLDNSPGGLGTVHSPFFDKDGDGYADIDKFGQFVDDKGAPLTLDPVFYTPIPPSRLNPPMGMPPKTDEYGRPATPIYTYVDTARTPLASVARSLKTLADPQNGALMDALAGARVLFGPREDARYDYTKGEADAILAAGAPCPTVPANACLDYKRFKGEESPLVDLLYAAGPILADEESDGLLLGLLDLVENHPQDVARLLGAALKVRQISLDHDKLVQQGKEPNAAMPYATPIWDEMAQVLAKIVEQPGLVQSLVAAFADPALTTPHGTSKHMGDTLANFMLMRDRVTYNPQNPNGPSINLTDDPNGGSTADPKHPVDQNKPKTGDNRSIFQRTLQLLHDVNKVPACNKEHAYVEANTGGDPGTCPKADVGQCNLLDDGFSIEWPILSKGYGECDLFRFENLAGFYVDALLPAGHPKRSAMALKDDTLNTLINSKFLGNPDDLFQKSSGICGLTEHPGPVALNRLVFYGTPSDLYNMPDIDPNNSGSSKKMNTFVGALIQPVGTAECPAKPNGVHECADASGTLRGRDGNTIFAWEKLGFYDYLSPVAVPFANVPECDNNGNCVKHKGEQMFVDLIDILYRHWDKDGGNTYEPILGDAFKTDLIPALVEFSKVATQVSKITVARGASKGKQWSGADVLAKTARILFSQDYAAAIGLTDRKGNKATKWTDGTPQAQITPYSMFADALHAMDVRFDTACDGVQGADADACKMDAQKRKAQWKGARSRLVDEFLTVDGDGSAAQFRNKGTPKLLARTLHLLREQVNAHCPDRETTGKCDWARKELPDKLARTFSGPLFAALMDLQESLRADDAARAATEQLLVYILSSDNPENLQAALSSFADILQVLQDDADLAPILKAIAPAAGAKDDPDGPGAGDSVIKVLKALTDDQYDPYHVMDKVLPALVTPMDQGQGRAPLEVFIDAIADIHRLDADFDGKGPPLGADDYGTIFGNVRDFMTSKTRGLEQFYYIVQHRPRE
jgi:hypothetical protein